MHRFSAHPHAVLRRILETRFSMDVGFRYHHRSCEIFVTPVGSIFEIGWPGGGAVHYTGITQALHRILCNARILE